jgi:two-component system response regulator ResD
MSKNILVVDDEKKIRELLTLYLNQEGFTVSIALDGRDALKKLSHKTFDLIILDLMMPGLDGWEVCREVRKSSNIPIIMLTARGDEIDRVLGLELGADDYVVKPFSPREMVARVKAVLRRSNIVEKRQKSDRRLEIGNLIIDAAAREIFINLKSVTLTPKEFDLLYFLAQSPGQAFTREQLLEQVWGYDFYGDLRTVDTHINRLREKIIKNGYEQQCIATVWGVGYKFEVANEN